MISNSAAWRRRRRLSEGMSGATSQGGERQKGRRCRGWTCGRERGGWSWLSVMISDASMTGMGVACVDMSFDAGGTGVHHGDGRQELVFGRSDPLAKRHEFADVVG